MKKTALVIMAAGIGSRYGNGIKQLAPVGPHQELIMDYSIRDAVEAGFSALMSVLVFVGGMIMLMLGMIGEYVGRVYLCINNSPQYVIREIVSAKE